MLPALYGRDPRPDVRPRYQPKLPTQPIPPQPIGVGIMGNPIVDPAQAVQFKMATDAYLMAQAEIQLAKDCATVIERGLTYSMSEYDFAGTMGSVVTDYLLTGRGVARVRYLPAFEPGSYERMECELVHWDDFRVWPARSWSETPAVAFRHRFTREQLVEQFGEVGNQIPLTEDVRDEDEDNERNDEDKTGDTYKRGLVWEIWHKPTRSVVFIAPSLKTDVPILDVPDPLGLPDFFPVPKPLYSIPDTASLVPLPEYLEYEDQATEIDVLTRRINATAKSVKYRGWYNGNNPEVADLLTKGDNTMVSVQSADPLADASKMVAVLPIDGPIRALQQLYQSREEAKQAVYEITGLSDILRGSTEKDETATAQDIKSRWGALRIQNRRRDIERMVVEILRMKAEIMAALFSPETLSAISGVQVTPEMLMFLRNDGLRNYRIDVETDSMVAPDRAEDQEAVAGVMKAVGETFAAMGMPMPPEVGKPLMLMAVRTFPSAGRELEDALNQWQPMPVAPMGGPPMGQVGGDGMPAPQQSATQPPMVNGRPNLTVIPGGQPSMAPA